MRRRFRRWHWVNRIVQLPSMSPRVVSKSHTTAPEVKTSIIRRCEAACPGTGDLIAGSTAPALVILNDGSMIGQVTSLKGETPIVPASNRRGG